MSIWDDLYSELVKTELKLESSSAQDNFLTVESKVEDLRRRVGLQGGSLPKQAGLNKAAASQFRLTLTASEEFIAAPPTQEEEDALVAMKSYLVQLVDQRRAGIDVAVAINDLHEKFGEFSGLINSNRHMLEDFFHRQQMQYKKTPSAPIPGPSTIKIDTAEDNATFENIADKLKM